jgi:antitoxin component YwqK of YwqJK toxin-antitoxin module
MLMLHSMLDILPAEVFTENIFQYLYATDITEFQSINKSAKQLISEHGRRIYEVCLHLQPHGQVLTRNEYGRILTRRNYRDGKLHGIQEWYNEHSEIVGVPSAAYDTQTWKMGRLHGERKTTYYGSEGLYCIENYVDGKMHGDYQSFYPNGRAKSQRYFEHNKIQGKEKEWYESGPIRKLKQWKDGYAHGEERQWHENGKLRFVMRFENGEELSQDITERSRKRARSNDLT